MKPIARAQWEAAGVTIRKQRLAQGLSLREVERRSGLWSRVITSVENGEHQPRKDTLKCLDAVIHFDEPLRSVLFSSEKPILWVPGDLVADADRASLFFRFIFYEKLIQLGLRATLIRYCTPVLATALSSPAFLRGAIEAKFGRSRQARVLSAQMMRRSLLDSTRIRRGYAKAEVLCLFDETRAHLRGVDHADRIDFIGHLLRTRNLQLRIATRRPTKGELGAFSFAMMTGGDTGGCVCITDQPLPGQVGRDCWIDVSRSDRFRHSLELYLSYWDDPHTYKAEPCDLRGI